MCEKEVSVSWRQTIYFQYDKEPSNLIINTRNVPYGEGRRSGPVEGD